MKLVLYYADWCGHCKTLKRKGGGAADGGWTVLEKEKRGGKLNFDLEAIEEKKIPSTIKIGGFPTIELHDNNGKKIASYMGDRSAADMIKFVNKNQAQRGGKRRKRRKTRKRRKRRKTRKRRSRRRRKTRRRRKRA